MYSFKSLRHKFLLKTGIGGNGGGCHGYTKSFKNEKTLRHI